MNTKRVFGALLLLSVTIVGLHHWLLRDAFAPRLRAADANLERVVPGRLVRARAAGQAVRFVTLQSDQVQHDVSTQDECKEVTAPAARDDRWIRGLSLNTDNEILGGDIVAYQIRWFNGNWSGWYVPGVNDISSTVNLRNAAKPNTMRRRWACFNDHTHRYLIVRKKDAATTEKLKKDDAVDRVF